MTDVLERLRTANPVSKTAHVGPPPVFEDAPQAGARASRSRLPLAGVIAAAVRSRRLSVLLASGLVVVGSGAALAAARSIRWWDGADSPPAIQTSSAEKLVEFTLSSGYSTWPNGTTIAMWRLPQDGALGTPPRRGWVCYFIALASPPPTRSADLNGGSCLRGSPNVAPGEPWNLMLATAPGEDRLLSGRVNPASGIAEVELQSANGRLPLSYANGWFIGQLPPEPADDKPPKDGPYLLLGRDDDGNVLARVDLEQWRASIEHPARSRPSGR